MYLLTFCLYLKSGSREADRKRRGRERERIVQHKHAAEAAGKGTGPTPDVGKAGKAPSGENNNTAASQVASALQTWKSKGCVRGNDVEKNLKDTKHRDVLLAENSPQKPSNTRNPVPCPLLKL